MATSDNYTIGIDVDLKAPTAGLATLEAAARKAQQSITALKNEIKSLSEAGGGLAGGLGNIGLSDDAAERMAANTKVYKEASVAVKNLATSYQNLQGIDPSKATEAMTNALRAMEESLRSITPMDQRRLEMLSQMIPLMTQAAAATKQQAQAEAALERAKQASLRTEQQQLKTMSDSQRASAEMARGLETSAYAAQRASTYYAAFSATAGALPALAVKNAASQERAFADVQRTTQLSLSSLEGLRQEYQKMSTEIPVAFEELSRIGTLGAQMDIAAKDLDDFTRAVSGFSAITGETVDSTAMAFGRLQNMLGGNLKESATGAGDGIAVLASQVAELGAKSVATEAEVLATAQSIATTAHEIGFSQDQILGYSAALASLKVPPEWARGSFQRVTAGITNAVAAGEEGMRSYAAMIGVTTQEFEKMWRSDPSAVLEELFKSIAKLDSVAKTTALNDLGIKATRDVQFVKRLSNNYELLGESIRQAGEASQDTDFLDNSVEIISGTFEESITRMRNALNNLLSNSGTSLLAPLKGVADVVTFLANAIDQLPSGMKAFIGSTLAVAAVRLAIQGLSLAALGFLGNVAQTRRELGALGLTGRSSLGAVAQAYRIATGEAVRLQAATAGAARATSAMGSAGAASGVAALGGAAARASGGIGLLKGGLSAAMGIMGGPWGLAITAGITALSIFSDHLTESTRRSEDFKNALNNVGGTEGLWEAIKKDSIEAAKGIQDNVTELSAIYAQAGDATDKNTDASKLWITTQGEVVTAAEAVERQLDANTLVMGKNTQQVLLDALKQTEAFKNLSAETATALNDAGFNLTEYITRSSGPGGKKAGDEYINGFLKTLQERQTELSKGTTEVIAGPSGAVKVQSSEAVRAIEDQMDALKALQSTYGDVSTEVEAAAAQAILMGQGFQEGAAGADAAEDAIEGVEGAAAGAAESIKDLNDQFHATIDAAFGVTNSVAGVYDALDKLATSVAENGTYFGPDSEGGRANLQALEEYLNAVVDLGTAKAEEAGLSVEETTDYVAGLTQEALDDLASRGYDLSGVDQAMTNLEASLGRTVQGPNVDDTNLQNQLTAMNNSAQQKVGFLQHLFNTAVELQNGINGLSSSMANGLGAGLKAGTAGGRGIGGARGQGARGAGARRRQSAAAQRLGGLGSLTGGYQGVARPRGGGGGGGGANSVPRQSVQRQHTPRQSTPRPPRQERAPRESRKREEQVKSAQELFEDFLSRLSSAMKKAMDSFWKTTVAQDAYHSQLNRMRKSIADTKSKIEDLAKANRRLTVDIQEAQVRLSDARMFNQIAKKYGDMHRAAATQADIDKALLEIQEKRDEMSKNTAEQTSLSRGMYALKGYTDAAIENRAALRALQLTMVEMVEAYAAQGHSTQQVEAYARQLKQEFIRQATQMGFNQIEVTELAGSFDGLTRSIRETPREAKVKATDNGTVPWTQDRIDSIHGHPVTMPVHADTTPFYNAVNNAMNYASSRVAGFGNSLGAGLIGGHVGGSIGRVRRPSLPGFRMRGFATGGKIPGTPPSNRMTDNLVARTPRGGMFGIRSGEWVMNQQAVKHYGDGFMKMVNERRFNPMPAAAPAQTTMGGRNVVELTSRSVEAIGRAVSTQVTLGNRQVADATNAGTRSYNNRGGY